MPEIKALANFILQKDNSSMIDFSLQMALVMLNYW
jgi:hypothetical protein